MASLEFIQKRIEGKEKELATLQKKLDRILKAQESNWEKNPYYYSERDLRVTQRDIELAEKALQGYKDQLASETEKANSRNIPVILEFLAQWKERVKEYYNNAVPQYTVEYNAYVAEDHAYVDWYNANGHRLFKEDRDEYDRREKEHRDKRAAFQNRWNFLQEFLDHTGYGADRVFFINEARLQKVLDQEADAKYDFIVERTNAIVGQITDASNLRIGAKGDLNGFIVGTRGTAKVSTISAEGPVQCFHYRTLIHKAS